MKVIVTGGTGFVGTALVSALVMRGHDVAVLDRNPRTRSQLSGVRYLQADLLADRLKPEWFDGSDAIVHLAGRNIFGTWSKSHKKDVYDSRIISAKRIIEVLDHLPVERRPQTIVSANAIGYYGDRNDEVLTESSSAGRDFLAQLCVQWETVWQPLQRDGARLVNIRTGIVLQRSGGAFQRLIPLFKWGLGTVVGSGRQWFSWISLQDLTNIYIHALENNALSGPINAVSPEPLRNKDFTEHLAKAVNRKHYLRVPKLILRLAGKDIATLLLASQRVKPVVLIGANFRYEITTIQQAVDAN